MKKIKLTQNQFAIVDDVCFEWLSQWKWYAQWSPHTESYYAAREVRKNGARFIEWMHREIVKISRRDSREVDHVDHDTLNNRKKNLRVVSRRENHENRRDQSVYGAGVRKRQSGKFQAYATVDGKQRGLGTFNTPKEAAVARIEFIAGIK